MTTLSSPYTTEIKSANAGTPEQSVRQAIAALSGIPTLPPTRSFGLYHIRGVGNAKYNGGEDKDVVLYGPEFLYVLDVGWPALCGVELGWNTSGRGDPHFPSFKEPQFRSVLSSARNELLFPCVPGELLVGVTEGTSGSTVRTGLKPYATDVKELIPDLYEVHVKLFHEPSVAKEIQTHVAFVRYASYNRIVRLIDFMPGWFVDQVS